MDLRPYQLQLIKDIDSALDEHRAVCAVLPTGGGKTVCFSSMARAISRQGASVWALAHREELVDQMSAKFLEFEVPHGLIKSGLGLSKAPVQCGMIQTTCNKLERLPPPDYLIIDECHHSPAAQYATIISAMPPTTRIIGFTATPCRLDGKGLGNSYTALVQGPTISELIGMGYLCAPRVYAPKLVDTKNLHTKMGDFIKGESEALLDTPAITGKCIDHYRRLASGTSAVVFCTSIKHAKNVADQFNAAGISAAHVDGKMSKQQRGNVLAGFRRKDPLVLTSADLISEGFDCPGIETAILLRPTKSESLYLQQVGRALRISDNKPFAIILDHVGNSILHGLPTDARAWSLAGGVAKKKDKEIEIKVCDICFLAYQGKMCPMCKVEKPVDGRKIEQREGELVEVQTERFWMSGDEYGEVSQITDKLSLERWANEKNIKFGIVRDTLIRKARSPEELTAVGRLLGYAPGWAQHRLEARRHHSPPSREAENGRNGNR